MSWLLRLFGIDGFERDELRDLHYARLCQRVGRAHARLLAVDDHGDVKAETAIRLAEADLRLAFNSLAELEKHL